MRELNPNPHKVRRSSFSNTLSQLPEVDEPYSDLESPAPATGNHVNGKATTEDGSHYYKKLPPILTVVDETLPPKSRPRIQSLPTVSKTKEQERNKELSKFYKKDPRPSGPPLLHMHLTEPYVESVPVRRWSIGTPKSRDASHNRVPSPNCRRGSKDNSQTHHSDHESETEQKSVTYASAKISHTAHSDSKHKSTSSKISSPRVEADKSTSSATDNNSNNNHSCNKSRNSTKTSTTTTAHHTSNTAGAIDNNSKSNDEESNTLRTTYAIADRGTASNDGSIMKESITQEDQIHDHGSQHNTMTSSGIDSFYNSYLEHDDHLKPTTTKSKGSPKQRRKSIHGRTTPVDFSTQPWNPLGNSRKYSDPTLVMGEKDRLEVMQDPTLNRRWSRPMFAETARKVNMVLKLGQSMRNKMNPREEKGEKPSKTIRTLADFAIDMPKQARFSAMMSPEAQYALMMGYEDKIYDGLVTQHPEYKKLLKRNKTPVQKVHIRRKNSLGFFDDDENDRDDGDSDGETTEKFGTHSHRSFITQHTESTALPSTSGHTISCSRFQKHRGSTQSLDSEASEVPERPDSRSTLRSLRRLSLSLEKKDYLNRLFEDGDAGETDADAESALGAYIKVQRSCSLPNVSNTLPFDRRLVLTHRLESAMDIVDAMKTREEMCLSPRLKRRKSIPFADYSSWVHEWNKEFRVDRGNS